MGDVFFGIPAANLKPHDFSNNNNSPDLKSTF